jgi:hypothetical protein
MKIAISKTFAKLRRTSRINVAIASIVVIGVAIVGYSLLVSRAAGPFVSVQPEDATLSGNASVANDASASGGKALKLAAHVVTPPPQTGGRSCQAWPAVPDNNCTGVPAGTGLTTINGELDTTADGQVIDSKNITGDLNVHHNNVIVKNTRIKGIVRANASDQSGLIIQDSEIAPDTYQVGNFPPIFDGNYTLLRVHVHRLQDGPRSGAGTVIIRDSILDDLAFAPAEHPDGFQQYGPGTPVNVTLDHNLISGCTGNSSDKGSSAMFWSDHPGTNAKLVVTNNLFTCGQYSIRINDTGSGISGNYSGVVAEVHNNKVVRGSYALGPTECDNSKAYSVSRGDGVAWSNNTFSDNGEQIASACAP